MKKCCTCKEIKPLSSFSKHIKRKDGHSDECKSCFLSYKRELRRRKKEWGVEMLGGKCADCGLPAEHHNLNSFHFHHTDPSIKEGSISKTFQDSTKEDIMGELKKCVLLCDPCHRKRHKDFREGLRETL